MARKRRTSRSSRDGQYVWSASLDEATLQSDTVSDANIISLGTDWAVSSSQRAVLKSIRGHIFYTSVAQAAACTVMAFIIKHDTDQALTSASFKPDAIQNYVDEDVLWTGIWRSPGESGTALGPAAFKHFELNVKVGRKMRANDQITLFTIASVANVVDSTVIVRGLVHVNG